jgi:hypothetical protein
LQNDFEIRHAERIKACSTPLLATGFLQEISSLALIAEAIWYSCHVKRKYYNQHYYMLISSVLCFVLMLNTAMALAMFLEHILLGRICQTPIGVENFRALL